jgi:putative transposase
VAFGPPDVLPTPLSRSPEDTADSSKCHTAGGVAKVMPDNNRAENSDRPTRQRQMQRFKSGGQAQRFLSTHAIIYGHFRPRRHLMAAVGYRRARAKAFQIWRQETCVCQAA